MHVHINSRHFLRLQRTTTRAKVSPAREIHATFDLCTITALIKLGWAIGAATTRNFFLAAFSCHVSGAQCSFADDVIPLRFCAPFFALAVLSKCRLRSSFRPPPSWRAESRQTHCRMRLSNVVFLYAASYILHHLLRRWSCPSGLSEAGFTTKEGVFVMDFPLDYSRRSSRARSLFPTVSGGGMARRKLIPPPSPIRSPYASSDDEIPLLFLLRRRAVSSKFPAMSRVPQTAWPRLRDGACLVPAKVII